jgi:FixJ family two-component response regulator
MVRAGVVKLLQKPIQDEQLFGWIEQACLNNTSIQ